MAGFKYSHLYIITEYSFENSKTFVAFEKEKKNGGSFKNSNFQNVCFRIGLVICVLSRQVLDNQSSFWIRPPGSKNRNIVNCFVCRLILIICVNRRDQDKITPLFHCRRNSHNWLRKGTEVYCKTTKKLECFFKLMLSNGFHWSMYFCDNYIGRKCTFSDRKEYFQNSEALKWCLSEHVRNNVNYKILYLQKYPDLQEVFFFYYFGVEMVQTDPVCFERYR